VLPLREPAFEAVAGWVDKLKVCGIDATRDIELVLFAQRLRGKRPQNVLVLNGGFDRGAIEVCRRQLAAAASARWLNESSVAIAMNEEAEPFAREMEGAGERLPTNPAFVRLARDVPATALAWFWANLHAMRPSLPSTLVPDSLLTLVQAPDSESVEVSVASHLIDRAAAGALEGRWRANAAALPEDALGRRWEYRHSGDVVTATMRLSSANASEVASVIASLVQNAP
jgi:hypothetical protein